MVYQGRWERGTLRRRTMAIASATWEHLASMYYHLLKGFNWCPLTISCHRRSDLLRTRVFPSSIKLNPFSYRLLSVITSQMPNLLPSLPATFHTPWPSVPRGWGSLFPMSGGLSSWAPFTGATGTDGMFGGCAECDDRDWLFLVKYRQETVHPSGSSRQFWHSGFAGFPTQQYGCWERRLDFPAKHFTTQLCSGLLYWGLHDTVVLSRCSWAKNSPVTNYDTK